MPKLTKVTPKSSLGAFRIQSLSTFCFTANVQENLEGNLEIRKTFEIALVSLNTLLRLTSVYENRGGRLDAARPTGDAFGTISASEI